MHVSDHALLRYCERFLGLDIPKTKEEISKLIQFSDNGEHLVANTGLIAIIKNDTVVTIIDKPKPKKRLKTNKKVTLKDKYNALWHGEVLEEQNL